MHLCFGCSKSSTSPERLCSSNYFLFSPHHQFTFLCWLEISHLNNKFSLNFSFSAAAANCLSGIFTCMLGAFGKKQNSDFHLSPPFLSPTFPAQPSHLHHHTPPWLNQKLHITSVSYIYLNPPNSSHQVFAILCPNYISILPICLHFHIHTQATIASCLDCSNWYLHFSLCFLYCFLPIHSKHCNKGRVCQGSSDWCRQGIKTRYT